MASASEDNYVCTLDEKSLKRAKEELGEDDKERNGAIQALREWALQQSWLKTPTDSAFLLRFLRVRKFSQLAARENLERYWTTKTKNKEWFNQTSPTDVGIQEVLDSGFLLMIPFPDDEGRRVFIERPGRLKIKELKKKYGLDIVIKTVCCFLDFLCLDERVQVNGAVILMDSSDTTTEHGQIYNPDTLKRVAPIFTKAMPARMKSINMYNASVVFETLIGIAKSTILPKKIADRVHTHGKNMTSVYKQIPQQYLPSEYLPDDYDKSCAGTIAELIEYTKNEMLKPDVVAVIKKLNSGKYNVDLQQRKQQDVPAASFRKLNVD